MSTTGQDHEPADAASDVAAAIRGASFVRVLARADGDSVAAAGLLARALDARGVPFQASAGLFDLADVIGNGDDATAVLLGTRRRGEAIDAEATDAEAFEGETFEGASSVTAVDPAVAGRSAAAGRSVSAVVADAVRELDLEPDPGLVLTGVVASGADPARATPELLGAAEAAGAVELRPGIASPTPDLADGLAHTTWAHAPFSGDVDAAREALEGAGLDPEDTEWLDETDDAAATGRTVASLLALATTGDASASDRSGEAIERALRPLAWPAGPFATVEGFADVLDAAARDSPGIALALASGQASGDGPVADAARSTWRDRSHRAHEAVRSATTSTYDDLFVARLESAPTATVARLLLSFRTDAPVSVVATEGRASIAAVPETDIAAPAREAADAVNGRVSARPQEATIAYGPGHDATDTEEVDSDTDTDPMDVVTAFREARRT